MSRRGIRTRLLIFAVVGLLAVGYAGARYARLSDLVWSSDYEVTVQLAETGGLFEGSEVTYRGVPVGSVTALDLHADRVEAVVAIQEEVRVPLDATAHVRNRSAVGEQYLDLQPPDRGSGSDSRLEDGSVIPIGRTTTPLPEEEVLSNLDDFVTTVDRSDLRTVVDELGLAFRGRGPDLRRLLEGSSSFVARAEQSLPRTRRLLDDAETVLGTQAELGGELQSFTRDLAVLAETLASRDPELRAILRDGGPAARELTALVDGLAPEAPRLLSASEETMAILVAHLAGVEQALVAFPESLAAAQAGVVDGQAQFSLALTSSPPVCQQGYLPPSAWRSPEDVSFRQPDYSLACREGDTTFRGSARAPLGAALRAALRTLRW